MRDCSGLSRPRNVFWRRNRLTKTKETFRKYISALPLFLSGEEYQKKLKELDADPYLVQKIQEHNAKVCMQKEYQEERERMMQRPRGQVLEEWKEQYRKSSKI